MSNIQNFLRVTGSQTRKDINKLLEAVQDLFAAPVEDTALHERIMFTPHIRLKTTTVTFGGPVTKNTDQKDVEVAGTTTWERKKPTLVKSYPLIHTTTGTFTFPDAGHKFMGNGVYDGSTYITVDDDNILDPTTELTIALFFKPQSSTGTDLIVAKTNQYELRIVDTNIIQFRIFSGSFKTPVTYDYTTDIGNFISVVATYKSTSSGQKLYIDKVLKDSDSETGAIGTSSNDLKIGGDGTLNLPNNSAMSWLTILSKEVSTAWIDDYHIALQDTSDGNTEILTIPFVGREDPEPDAVSGLCRSD